MSALAKGNVLQPSNLNVQQQKQQQQPQKGARAPYKVKAEANSGRKSSFGVQPPASVARRNARERNRVKQVKKRFDDFFPFILVDKSYSTLRKIKFTKQNFSSESFG